MASEDGFEPPTCGFGDRRSANWNYSEIDSISKFVLESINQCLQNLRDQFDVIDEIHCDYDSLDVLKIDLYPRLKKIRQEQFGNNQRIVFVLGHDFYSEDCPAGAILQAIQIIVEDIDISNFFVCIVTANSNIKVDYAYVHEHISWDSVPFHCYACSGEFVRRDQTHACLDGKKQSLKHIVDIIDCLSDAHKTLLFDDPVFCMMPWVGINIEPNNVIRPCCEFQGSIGNTANNTIAEIWNGDAIKQIRRAMLQHQAVPACQQCYHKESLKRDSLRNSINRDFASHTAAVDATQIDGTVPVESIVYWDIRYNNLCNFACRSCGPAASSSWYQVHNDLYPDQKRQFPLLQAGQDSDKIFKEISQNIDRVEKIYFAGGEPLMIDNFYRILEMLDALGRHDVHLCYNTNLSRLGLKQRSVLDLWARFSNVSVGASLDAMGSRAAYLRVGTVWNDIVTNRKKIQDHCPHVDFYVSATTGLINALHVVDFHEDWVRQGLITADDFNIQLLYDPAYMSVKHAPERLKHKIIQRYQHHIQWLRDRDRTGRALSGVRSVVKFCQEPGQYDGDRFWAEVNKLDRYYSTDLLATFPELQDSGL